MNLFEEAKESSEERRAAQRARIDANRLPQLDCRIENTFETDRYDGLKYLLPDQGLSLDEEDTDEITDEDVENHQKAHYLPDVQDSWLLPDDGTVDKPNCYDQLKYLLPYQKGEPLLPDVKDSWVVPKKRVR